jgi:hypothetical protein
LEDAIANLFVPGSDTNDDWDEKEGWDESDDSWHDDPHGTGHLEGDHLYQNRKWRMESTKKINSDSFVFTLFTF